MLSHIVNGVEGGRHLGVQSLMDQIQRPVEIVSVLDLLKVANCDAAGVAQEVGYDIGALFVQNLVGFRSGRTVGQLSTDFGFDIGRVGLSDYILQRRREEHHDVQFQQLFIGDGLGVGHVNHGAVLFLPCDALLEGNAFFSIDTTS